MDYKQLRIRTDLGLDNKYINFKLEQEFDNINILSLKLTQSDVYNTFNSDYGCVVGRVIANNGVGIPNAKISIFIPITDEDQENEDIKAIYPYKTPEDLDLNGYKYNLLPRVSQVSPFLDGIVNEENIGYKPDTPIGTFPTKEEILTNDILLDIYKKYYKFTTVTNESGDYMIFGVPVGTHIIHMSVDITDIGKFSMKPPTMIKLLGFPENLFDNNGTTIKKTNDLDNLPNVQLQNISIDVRPFWGDEENFEIGITRQDFKIKATLSPTFTVFGSMFTMGQDGLWGISKSNVCNSNVCSFHTINNYDDGDNDISGFNAETFRLARANTEIYTISNNITDDEINSQSFDINRDIVKLNKSDYSEFIDNGVFAYVIPCNRKKIITNEFGEIQEVENDNPDGVFTEFNGYFLMDSEDLSIIGNSNRSGLDKTRGPFIRLKGRFKVPQNHTNILQNTGQNLGFIKKNRKFESGEIYSIGQFYGISFSNDSGVINSVLDRPKQNTLGIIQTQDFFIDDEDPEDPDDLTPVIKTTTFPSNTNQSNNDKYFGSQWINMSIFQIQFGASDRKRANRVRASGFLFENSNTMFFIDDNTQNLGGGKINSKGFLTARHHYFDFIKIDREDVIKMSRTSKKVLRSNLDDLSSDYKYTPNGTLIANTTYGSGGIIGRDFNNNQNEGAYIYKGLFQSDCIEYIINLNLI